jgi:hypothetical protein
VNAPAVDVTPAATDPDDDLTHVVTDDEGIWALCGRYVGDQPWKLDDPITCRPCAVLDALWDVLEAAS